jgi:hypothetical protein
MWPLIFGKDSDASICDTFSKMLGIELKIVKSEIHSNKISENLGFFKNPRSFIRDKK